MRKSHVALRLSLAIIGLTLTTMSVASAGSFNPALEDPVVIAPTKMCTIMGVLPCHVPGHVTTMDGSDEPVLSTPVNEQEVGNPSCNDTKKSSKKTEKKAGKKDKDHSNASGNNGRGGNYEQTGHSDNGKGNGRGRR